MTDDTKTEAATLADEFDSRAYHGEDDLTHLPAHVQVAVLAVQESTASLHKRVAAAHKLFASDPGHELAIDPDADEPQSTASYRFEEVGGEIVEVRKDSHGGHVKIIYRPDLVAAEKADPASEIEAEIRRLAADQAPPSDEPAGDE